MIQFAQPLWLYGTAAALLLLTGWAWWADRRSRRLLERFVAGNMVQRLVASFSRPRQRFKAALSVLACFFLLLAFARPQWGTITEEIELQGVDILFALDTSRSMLAEDYQPNRLERAKLAILDLVSRLEGDRVGLIAFAGNAFLQCPLTLDYSSFLLTLQAINTDTIPRGGTDIAAAIEEAMAYFQETDHHRVLVLISDGEDLEASGILRAREAAAQGIAIFTLGIGSPEGELIPLRSPDGSVDYLRDPAGNPVRTRLDEASLQAIASAGNGIYRRLGRGPAALDEVYAAARSTLEEATMGALTRERPIERYHWPLALGLLCLVMEWSISNRRRLPKARTLAAVLVGLLGWGAFGPGATPATASPRLAERLYRSGNYEEAAHLWKTALESKPNDAKLHYNLGNAHYRRGDFAAAIAAYRQALPLADIALQERIFYNLGNAQFQLGQKEMPEAPARTRDLWEDALLNYGNSLALNPNAQDARNNRSLVEQEFTIHGARVEVTPAPARGGTASGGGLFLPGMVIELEAEANPGWRFVMWHGAEVEEADRARTKMTVRQHAQVLAVFRETRELKVQTEEAQRGTAKTSGRYDLDQDVPIEATAADYFAFDRWISDTLTIADPSAPQTTVNLSGDGAVTATFTEAYHLKVTAEPEIAGNVGTTGFYRIGSDVAIQAEARDGFEWTGWIGEGIADRYARETTITLDADRLAAAHFERIWNLVVLPDHDESGTTTGGGNYPIGSLQPIEAVANEGHSFLRWEGPGVREPEAASTTVEILPGEQTVIAVFEQEESEGDDQSENSDSEGESGDSGDEDTPQKEDPSREDESSDPESESDAAEDGTDPADEQPAKEQPAERERPESLTEEEARQLLQMLRQDERQLPLRLRSPGDDESTTGRDW
jgi:Ca-activated chloride channel homolog